MEVPQRGSRQLLALASLREFDEYIVLRMCRTWLIVVAHEVAPVRATLASLVLAAIARVATSPVEVDVVLIFQKHILVNLGIGGSVDTCRATVVADQQVVVERSRRASPLASIAPDALVVACIKESLVHNTPLDGGIVVVVDSGILLAAPAKAAVVDDDIPGVLNANGSTLDEVLLLRLSEVALGAQSRTDITDDDILRPTQVQLATTQQDALAWSCLTCDGDVLQLGTDGVFALALRVGAYVDDATDAKHDGGILLAGIRQRPAQRALASVVQVSHLHHFASASARGVFPETLCRWEGQCPVVLCPGAKGHHGCQECQYPSHLSPCFI